MNARDFALLELDSRRLPEWTPVLPKRAVDRAPPDDPRDRALGERITIGVIKNHLLLLHLVRHYSGRTTRQMDPLVLKILQIALYQLRCMDRIPASAAVDEAVEQCRRFGRPRAAGFVNAVLRNATRQPHPDLPDSTDPERYAVIVLSHPPDLFRRLTKIMSVDDAIRFCEHNNSELPTLVRLFRGVTVDQIAADDVSLTPHEQPGIFVVEPAKKSVLQTWAHAGLAQVQDATSARAVQHMDIHPHQHLLDRCAGLGTKTLQMHEYLGERGSIVAVDPSEERCTVLRNLLQVRGINNIVVHQVSMLREVTGLDAPAFDRVLVDAPCSNSGVLARRPEARYAQDQRSLNSLTRLQRGVLDDTAPYLHPGGLLVYSTCSVWPEENELQLQSFMERHPGYTLIESHSTLPSFDANPSTYHDGGFIAALIRT